MRPSRVRSDLLVSWVVVSAGDGVCSLTTVERTYYRVLGVRPGATADEVRGAYRGLVRRLHPDHQPELTAPARSLAERRMREINEAWSVLGDDGQRTRYDESLRRAAEGSATQRRDSAATKPTGGRAEEGDEPPGSGEPFGADDDLEDIDLLRPLSRGEAFLLQRGPWIAAVLIALALLIGTAYAGSGRMAPTTTPSNLQSGIECVDTPAEPCGP